MSQPISRPVVPEQPQASRYPVSALRLFVSFNRASYLNTFGVEASPFDSSRAPKTWFDTTADASRPGNVAVYTVLGKDAQGGPVLEQKLIPAAEAIAVNLPLVDDPAEPLPLRALLQNERLEVGSEPGSETIWVIRTDLEPVTTGFTPEDRQTLHQILDFLTKPPAAPAGGLFGEVYAPPPPPLKPAMPYANSADAYWAAQPPEVQQLRNLTEREDRQGAAYKLAMQGFTIDPRIMVQGWDPLSAMRVRASAGYTWVPALGQPQIEVSPGLTFPGLKTYDPNNPPPGSILVSTAFADGYEY